MTGALWAVIAGFGFGLFQTVNRRALRGMDVFTATFLQLATSAVVLLAASAVTENLSLLRTAPAAALMNFGLAGFFHFVAGWTLLNVSQQRIGAARTSPLIGTTPLFATVFAALALREIPELAAVAGILIVVAGAYLISTEVPVAAEGAAYPAPGRRKWWGGAVLGLGAALCYAISPIFIRRGLAGLPSPLLGVTVGLLACVVAYGVTLLVRWSPARARVSRDALMAKLVAGVLVGLSTWTRWIALALAPVGVVLAISQISVPVVLVLSPLVVGRHLERITARVWMGAACTVGGCLVLVLVR